jgi:hypothetical protein
MRKMCTRNRLVVDVDVDVVDWNVTLLDREWVEILVSQVARVKTAVKIVPRARACTDCRKSFTQALSLVFLCVS